MKEKTMKTVKILTITLLVILISMISFVGIYQKNKNKMENKVKDYSYSMSLNGARTIKLKVNTESTDDVPNNSEEVLTAENYKKSKEVIEKRLNKMNVEEYTTSVNEATGEITIQIPEQNSQTDTIIGNLNTVGKFEILDSETKEVLLNNDDIKSSEVLYNTTNSGTSVYLQIEFNKNGKDKLKNVSQTYVSVNNTTNNTTENNVAENTTSETTGENQTTDETTSEKESTTTFGQVVTKENEPTTNGKTTTRVDGVNKKSLKQTKILKVKKLKNRKVRITFKKISKAKIYRIQYSTNRKFKKNVRTKRTRKNTYLLRKLRVRKRYYVRVRAIVGKDKGKWSRVKSFKVR